MDVVVGIISLFCLTLIMAVAIKLFVNSYGKRLQDERLKSVFTKFGLALTLGFILVAFESYKKIETETYVSIPDTFAGETVQVIPDFVEEKTPPRVEKPTPPEIPMLVPEIVEVDHDVVEPIEIEQPDVDDVTEPVPVVTTSSEEPKEEPVVSTRPAPPVPREPKVWNVVEKMPEYPGGIDALRREIGRKYRIPRSLVNKKKGGKVFVQFIVDKDGSITNAKVVKGIDGCDTCSEEALRVFGKLKHKFSPGMQAGHAVRVRYTVPIVLDIR